MSERANERNDDYLGFLEYLCLSVSALDLMFLRLSLTPPCLLSTLRRAGSVARKRVRNAMGGKRAVERERSLMLALFRSGVFMPSLDW